MAKPHFHFLTLFPDTIHPWLNTSIIGRAFRSGVFDYTVHQLRDFSTDPHRSVDDAAYGGGGGMILKIEPLVAAVESIRSLIQPLKLRVICFTPGGRRLDTPSLARLGSHLESEHFLLACGHYEGIDQRFLDRWVDEEVSLGDFVITGGELPALVLVDALLRKVVGTLPSLDVAERESFSMQDPSGLPLVEYPHFTRPRDFRGLTVPPVLLSGDHAAIQKWRDQAAIDRTHSRIAPARFRQNNLRNENKLHDVVSPFGYEEAP